jgi:hypothetical protein
VTAGDNLAAKATVTNLLDQLGFDTVDAGQLKEGWRISARDTSGGRDGLSSGDGGTASPTNCQPAPKGLPFPKEKEALSCWRSRSDESPEKISTSLHGSHVRRVAVHRCSDWQQ